MSSSISICQLEDQTMFRNERLWAVDGRIRRAADVRNPNFKHPGQWDARLVVLAANNYQQAHCLAEAALIHNFSSAKHEAEVHAVRPATGTDLAEFAHVTDPGWRILVPENDNDV